MANRPYLLGLEAYLEGTIASLSDTLSLALCSSVYTPNTSTDQFLNPALNGSIVGTPVALTSKTGSGGTLSAANTTFTALSGTTVTQMVLYKDTGTDTTSPLIMIWDTASGLPLTPNGGNVVVAWSSGQLFTLFEGLAEKEQDWHLLARLREWRRWLRDSAPKPRQIWLPEPKIVLG